MMTTTPVIYPTHRLRIDKTWKGLPLPLHAQSYLEMERRPAGVLLDFSTPFYEDPPPPVSTEGEIVSTPELWNYEVLELFIAHGEQYTEIEVGPHGHYLVLRFQGMRQRVSEGHPLRYKSYVESGQWMGTLLIENQYLPPEPWSFNAYRIHGVEASRCYLSAFAQSEEAMYPDFHQLPSFQPLRFS